jgi:hypothetical protein
LQLEAGDVDLEEDVGRERGEAVGARGGQGAARGREERQRLLRRRRRRGAVGVGSNTHLVVDANAAANGQSGVLRRASSIGGRTVRNVSRLEDLVVAGHGRANRQVPAQEPVLAGADYPTKDELRRLNDRGAIPGLAAHDEVLLEVMELDEPLSRRSLVLEGEDEPRVVHITRHTLQLASEISIEIYEFGRADRGRVLGHMLHGADALLVRTEERPRRGVRGEYEGQGAEQHLEGRRLRGELVWEGRRERHSGSRCRVRCTRRSPAQTSLV